ncbi:hypothetical protein MC885_004398 [Smutsia gigantea]|nr:hypothetical protein MC885_004398 [Smutsia gigantea]
MFRRLHACPSKGDSPRSVGCLLFMGVSGILRESLDCEAWVGLRVQRLHGKGLLISWALDQGTLR